MKPLHSLGQDDQNEVPTRLFSHVTLLTLALASHDASNVVKGPLHFLGKDNQNEVQHTFWSLDATGISVTCCQQHCQRHHCIPYMKATEMMCNMTFLVMRCHCCLHQCHMMPMVSSMASLHSLCQRQLKWSATWLFCMPITPLVSVLASHDAKSVVNGTAAIFRWRWLKWGVIWPFGYVIPLVLALVLHDAKSIVNGTIATFWSR